MINRLSGNPSGHLAQQFLTDGKKPQVGAAIIQIISQHLGFTNSNISAVLTRRFQDTQRKRIDTGHKKGAVAVGNL